MRQVTHRSFVVTAAMSGALFLYTAGLGGHAGAVENVLSDGKVAAQDVEAIRQLGTTMGDAMVAVDMGALDRIYADDWAAVAGDGKVMTKKDVLESIRVGDHRLLSYQLGPIDVRVLGDLAVAHGTVKERRFRSGKPVDMEGVYMDFLKKRDGHWVVVRSAGAVLDPHP